MIDNNIPIQSLIDHIKTAMDVDPWTKEMAEELLKEQEAIPPGTENDGNPGAWASWWYVCGACGREIDFHDRFCRRCGQAVKWE